MSEHQRYFLGARYKADVAFVTDDRFPVFKGKRHREGLLTDLARANEQVEVLFDECITKENRRRYARVVVYDAKLISHTALIALTCYAQEGGRMIVYGQTGAMDRWGQPRQENPMQSAGPWRTAHSEAALSDFIRENTTPSFEVVDCPYVLFTITKGSQTGEECFVVHLLNYQKQLLEGVQVRYLSDKQLRLHALTPRCGQIGRGTIANEWVIPKLGVYSIRVMED